MDFDKEVLIYEGILSKKCKHGPKGFKIWQRRFFRITSKNITYSKSPTSPILGRFKPQQIRQLALHGNKRAGARFDISVEDGRTYALDSESQEESVYWMRALKEAVDLAREQNKGPAELNRIIDEKQFSSMQLFFFSAFFGAENMIHKKGATDRDKAMQQAIIEHIEANFKTDTDVLTYLLTKILDPDCGYFQYNFTDDSFNEDNTIEEEDAVEPVENSLSLQGIELTHTMSIYEMLALVGQRMSIHMEEFYHLFEDEGIQNVYDLLDAEIPADLPPNIEKIICEALEKIRYAEQKIQINEYQGLQDVVKILKTKEFIRRAVLIFSADENKAHGLALRVIWAIYFGQHPPHKALSEFKEFCNVKLQRQLSLTTKNTLVALLLSEPNDVTQKLENPARINFNMKVKAPYLWVPFLLSLNHSSMATRRAALEDIISLLHENLDNAQGLIRTPLWQLHFFKLLLDMEEEKRKEEPTYGSYAFTIDALTRVHFEHLLKSEQFGQVFSSTISVLHKFGGQSTKAQRVANSIFLALINKLTAAKKRFPSSMKAMPWQNLPILSEFVTRFVFTTRWWDDEPDIYVGKSEVVEDTEEDMYDSSATASNALSSLAFTDRTSGFLMDLKAERSERAKTFTEDVPRAEFEIDADNGDGQVEYLLTRGDADLRFDWLLELKEQNIKNFGLHWVMEDWPTGDERPKPQPCSDTEMVLKMVGLLKALRVDQYDPEVTNYSREEADSAVKFKALYHYWVDAGTLLSQADRLHVFDKLYSYRRLSSICKDFLLNRESGRGRKAQIKYHADRIKKK